jgi:hypothetical protein
VTWAATRGIPWEMHDDKPAEDLIAAHIEAVTARADGETRGLISALVRSCWPGGSSDRTEPGALEWVRRWGPTQLTPGSLGCSCAAGRCAVCN